MVGCLRPWITLEQEPTPTVPLTHSALGIGRTAAAARTPARGGLVCSFAPLPAAVPPRTWEGHGGPRQAHEQAPAVAAGLDALRGLQLRRQQPQHHGRAAWAPGLRATTKRGAPRWATLPGCTQAARCRGVAEGPARGAQHTRARRLRVRHRAKRQRAAHLCVQFPHALLRQAHQVAGAVPAWAAERALRRRAAWAAHSMASPRRAAKERLLLTAR